MLIVSLWLAASYMFHNVEPRKTSNLSRAVAYLATEQQTKGLLLKSEAFKNVSVSHKKEKTQQAPEWAGSADYHEWRGREAAAAAAAKWSGSMRAFVWEVGLEER